MREHHDLPEGYVQPVRQALIKPVLLMGVPRSVAIINLTVAGAVTLGAQQWMIGIPLGVACHLAAAYMTRRDPLWFDVLVAHVKAPRRLRT